MTTQAPLFPDPAPAQEWNPRFVAYARSQGHAPEAQLALDNATYAGGSMTGFVLWVGQQWRDFYRETGRTASAPCTVDEHAAFDAWLQERTRA
jgi:hypothetical protein